MDINGHHPNASLNAQIDAQQQFQQFVQNALLQAAAALGPQFKASAIFTHATDRNQDILMVPADLPIPKLIEALRARAKAAGLQVGEPEPVVEPTTDVHLAIINLVSVVRRALPFITGPGAETAKRMLIDGINAQAASETARCLVAGYLSSVPGMTDRSADSIERMLACAEDGGGDVQLIALSPSVETEQ